MAAAEDSPNVVLSDKNPSVCPRSDERRFERCKRWLDILLAVEGPGAADEWPAAAAAAWPAAEWPAVQAKAPVIKERSEDAVALD